MGGPRASTVRRRRAGLMCAFCHRSLQPDPTQPPGERLCPQCTGDTRMATHTIYLRFLHRVQGWECAFFEQDMKTCLRELCFQSPDKLMQLAERGGALKVLADRQAAELAIYNGMGGLWLNLTEDQYRKLKHR